jgi:hypothetical protein
VTDGDVYCSREFEGWGPGEGRLMTGQEGKDLAGTKVLRPKPAPVFPELQRPV